LCEKLVRYNSDEEKIMFRRTLQLALVSMLFCGSAACADYRGPQLPTPSLSAASPPLLTAGMFRLESERSYKLSLQMALGILSTHTEIERTRSLDSITRLRKELRKSISKSDKTERAFKRANLALNDQLEALPNLSVKTAAAMYDANEDLLIKMNFLSFAIEAETEDTASRITGLALRQASLAQRMAKIVLLRSMDKTMALKQGLQVDLAQTKIEFLNGMALLTAETKDEKSLEKRMVTAQQQWLFYEKALNAATFKPEDLRNISTTSDRIAEMMVEIVRLGFGLVANPKTLLLADR
jgi:hypothetical protein